MSSPLRSVRSAKSSKSKSQKQLSLGQIEHPQKVRVLILTQQKLIYQEYYFLKNFTQIIKLDLSYNKISQFPQGFSFKHFQDLKTLFLHYNKFDKLKNLQLLADCKKLVYFTLFGNPLEQSLARHFCINVIPSLKLMDDKLVKQQEKYEGILRIQSISQNDRIGFPLIEISQQQSSLQFLGCVMKQIKMAKSFYLKVNPIVVIQKWWKHLYKKKNTYQKIIKQKEIQNQQIQPSIKQQVIKVQKIHSSFSNKIKQNIDVQYQNDSDNQKQLIFQNQKLKAQCNKIIRAFQTLFQGLKSFKHLLNEESSLFCSKSYCILNGYKYKQQQKFKNKYLSVYLTPFNNQKYDLKKQKSKTFLSFIFYNNFNYLIELKSRKQYFLNFKSQLKNIQVEKTHQIQNENSNQIVQIELNNQQKLQILKKEYFKCKIPHYLKPFPFLFGNNLIKISSAVKIQKRWRGYYVRKNFNALNKVREQIAARKIQKWVKQLKFYHRQRFLIQSLLFLKNNQSPNITMKLQTFCKLHQVYEKILIRSNFMKLPFQQCSFQIHQKILNEDSQLFAESSQLNLRNKQIKTQIQFLSQRQPFPSYFSKFIQEYQLKNSITNQEQDIDTKKFKIIDLLIKGAIQVKKFYGFKDNKKKQKFNFVKIQYLNKDDANKRKFLLCLLTYNFSTKNWIQFYSQKNPDIKNNLIVMNEQIKKTHFIKMIYDNDKKQKLYEKIQKYTKQIKSKTEIQWIPVKIRYFQGSIDYSSILIIGIYKKNNNFANNTQNDQNADESQITASRKRLKQLNSLKTLQSKIVLNNLDSRFLTPMGAKGSIHRNPLNFSIHLGQENGLDESINQKKYYEYKKQKYFHSLHNNNVDYSLQDGSQLQNSINSYGSSLPMRNSNLDQSRNQNDISILDSSMSQKKLHIQKVKSSHKYKLQMLTEIKKRKQQESKLQYKTNAEQNKKIIRESSNSSLLENITKARRIKQYQKNRSSTNKESQKFENKFLRKGNFSIQNQMRQFQKSRSRSNNQKEQTLNQNKIKKSARYQQKIDNTDIQNRIGQARQYFKTKQKIVKTELKQFSIQLSEGFQHLSSTFPQNQMQYSDSINQLFMEHKRSKQIKTFSRREALSSATSQKITKLYQQKRKEFLKSQGKQEIDIHMDPIIEKNKASQIVINQKNNQKLLRQNKQEKRIQNEKKKMMKKKKLVHSVFPQEFFPLKDSQQIGFHLPKINSNQSKN